MVATPFLGEPLMVKETGKGYRMGSLCSMHEADGKGRCQGT